MRRYSGELIRLVGSRQFRLPKHLHFLTVTGGKMSDNKLFAFVLMPFDGGFDDIYNFGVKQTAETLGIVAERVDEQIYKEGMLERIYNQIEAADIIIADMSGKNPNVFYEVGFAHAKEKFCILLTDDAEDIPFDLKHKRHIVYGGSIQTLRRELSRVLLWAKSEIQNVKDKRIQVILKRCAGFLEKTRYTATAEIELHFDLHNESAYPSPEIEAGYVYSGQGWRLTQHLKECPSSDSDVEGFVVRHFIEVPVRRLRQKTWAQIRIEGKRLVASALDGEKLEDSYKVHGRCLFRLITSEGNADYEFLVDTAVDNVPF